LIIEIVVARHEGAASKKCDHKNCRPGSTLVKKNAGSNLRATAFALQLFQLAAKASIFGLGFGLKCFSGGNALAASWDSLFHPRRTSRAASQSTRPSHHGGNRSRL